MGLPDRKGREDILRLYAQKQLRPALAASLNQKEKELDARWAETAEAVIRETASRSYGASPAELANLVNEAGILAAGRGWRPGPVPADNCQMCIRDSLECEIIKQKGPVGIGKATATVDGKLAASAELTFMIG